MREEENLSVYSISHVTVNIVNIGLYEAGLADKLLEKHLAMLEGRKSKLT